MERMISGKLYHALDDSLREDMKNCKLALYEFNNMTMDKLSGRIELLKSILGSTGEMVYIEPPFY
ncbi:MAG: maltose acetyltransferase domain-containing protein, partial [Ruminococcus sp.]